MTVIVMVIFMILYLTRKKNKKKHEVWRKYKWNEIADFFKNYEPCNCTNGNSDLNIMF